MQLKMCESEVKAVMAKIINGTTAQTSFQNSQSYAFCIIFIFGMAFGFRNNGPYSSFCLKVGLWGQSNKNLHKFYVITNMIVVNER